MIKSQIILPWLILATASCMLVRYLYVSAVKDMNHDKESFYQVEFKILHKKLEVCAFLDTGNFLYEPVSQMPVCILEEETFLKYFHEPLFKMIEKQEAEILQLGAGSALWKRNTGKLQSRAFMWKERCGSVFCI